MKEKETPNEVMNKLNNYISQIIEVRKIMYWGRKYTSENHAKSIGEEWNKKEWERGQKGFVEGIKVIKKLFLDCVKDIKNKKI